MKSGQHGVVLLDKPGGESSFGCLAALKRELRTTRVGHAGTLDPFATGLLVAVCGCCTKLMAIFQDMPKEYEAEMVFGVRTNTLDPEGDVVERGATPAENAVTAAAEALRGELHQRPPLFSAIHVGGKRAYDLARSGQEVQLTPRRVVIYGVEVLELDLPRFRFRLRCSKGTYVRSVARDLGESLGTCGSLLELRRTRIGPFAVGDAVAPGAFRGDRDLLGPRDLERHGLVEILLVRKQHAETVRHGGQIRDEFFERAPLTGRPAAVYDGEELCALVQRDPTGYSYRAVVTPGD